MSPPQRLSNVQISSGDPVANCRGRDMFIRIPWPPPQHFSRPLTPAPFPTSSARQQPPPRMRLSTASDRVFRRLRKLRPKVSNSKPGIAKTQGCNESLVPTIVITPFPRSDTDTDINTDEDAVETVLPALVEAEDGEWESCSDNDDVRDLGEEVVEEHKEPWPASLWASVPLSFVNQDLSQTVPRNLIRRPHTHRRKLECGMYKWQVTRLNTIVEVGGF